VGSVRAARRLPGDAIPDGAPVAGPDSSSTDAKRRRAAQPNPGPHRIRIVLGDQTYESLARKGETTTTAAMVTYGYDQIDQARAELNAVSKGKDDI
jgi:hypothetical protein